MPVNQPGVWGIDLGQCALKAIRLEVVDGEITATAFDYIEHPKILSQPDADPDQLTREALDKFLSRNNLRGDTIAISVPGQSGLARFVKLPPVEEKKIGDIVRFEAKQQIPFPLEEVVWDFQKLSAGVVTDGFALETEIGLFAMKRDMVNRYLQHFQDVNVEVHIVQMAPLALCNFVSHDLLKKDTIGAEKSGADEEDDDEETSGKKQCVVALDIGTDNSNLVITDGERIIWQRPIPIGGNHFTRSLTKDLKLTFAKAEHLKRNAVKSPDLKKILAALRPVLNDFVSEVQRSLGYFTNTHRDAHVKYMIGLGNAFRLPGLQKFLQEKLQLEVRKLGEFKRLRGEDVTGAPQFTENILSFAVAHGLGLQGLKLARLQTNLLPHEIRTERFVRAKKPWAVAAAGILLLAVAGLAFGRSRQYAAYANPRVDKALAEGKKYLEEAKGYATEWTRIEGEATKSKEAVRRIAAGVDERFNWNLLYEYINDALPRPDGSHIPVRTQEGIKSWEKYFQSVKGGGKKAFDDARARRAAAEDAPPGPNDAKAEDEIKKRTTELHVEGIIPLYSDDLPAFYKKLKDDKSGLLGMRSADKDPLLKGGEGLPKSGWLVEIRGFTYNAGGKEFVVDTLVENLANPDAAGIRLSEGEKKQVKDKVRCAFLYRSKLDDSPQAGVFKEINRSYLRDVLGGGTGGPVGKQGEAAMKVGGAKQASGETAGEDAKPAGPNRDAWRPLGEVASASFGVAANAGGNPGGMQKGSARPVGEAGAPGTAAAGNTSGAPVVRVPRTEFVVFFIWQEPLPPDGAEAQPATPATPATP